ncbi:MAG: cytochrome o ubiquinol oxidase subunit IV [Lautropia sp.]|nr:cytochrome o ubiquinol oxidase subunit IV [Lautropia sp.]
MSAHDHHGQHGADAHHGHDDHHGEETLHFTARDYHVGFVLSVILTVIPFGLVMGKVFDNAATAALWVLGIGAVQMVYFLHMNRKSQGGWIMLALIFTVIILAIAVAGSLWVMFHLNENLMPASEHMLRIRP